MANEIIQMSNPENGNNQYPQTVLRAITDDAGNNLQRLIEKAPVARPFQIFEGTPPIGGGGVSGGITDADISNITDRVIASLGTAESEAY